MIHPNKQAEAYIWKKLTQWALSPSLLDAMSEWDQLQKLLLHKPFHPNGNAHQQFLQQTIKRFEQFSYWHVSDEIASLKAQQIN